MVKHNDVKAILALFILLVGFGVLGIFNTYQNQILEITGFTFQLFMTLTVVAMALLLGLLYLVSNSQAPKAKKTVTKSKSKSKRK